MQTLIYTFRTNKHQDELSKYCSTHNIPFFVLDKLVFDIKRITKFVMESEQNYHIIGIAEIKKGPSRCETYAYNLFHKHIINSNFPARIKLDTEDFTLKPADNDRVYILQLVNFQAV